jgi:hypothetical protein
LLPNVIVYGSRLCSDLCFFQQCFESVQMLFLNALLLLNDVVELPEIICPTCIFVKPMKTEIGSTRQSRPRQITQLSLNTAMPFFAQPFLFLLTQQY